MAYAIAGTPHNALESIRGHGSRPAVDIEIRQAVVNGLACVLVEARLLPALVPEGELPGAEVIMAQREAIRAIQGDILACLPGDHVSLVRRYETVPFLALVIDAHGLKALERLGDIVARVLSDRATAASALSV